MKFNIGDKVVNKVQRIGSFEPSKCQEYSIIQVVGTIKSGDSVIYVCTMDGYEFKEDELMSLEEYIQKLRQG